MATLAHGEATVGGRDLGPWEAVVCEALTDHIRYASTSTPGLAAQTFIGAHPQTLEDALRDAAITIRYNAKWFTEAALATLIDIATIAASSSSASADLNAAVTLIEVIQIYSLIPTQSLSPITKFLAQTYYNANRAHKTKKLAEFAWRTLQHILGSHLGAQCVVTLMEIVDCRDDIYLESKIGYAVTAGALMIIAERMVLKNGVDGTIPTPGVTDLLSSLWGTAVNGNHNLRELIMEIVVAILRDENAVRELDDQGTWEVLLDTAQPCVAMTPDSKAALALVDCLTQYAARFELRLLPDIAELLVDVQCPLTRSLSTALLEPWLRSTPSKEWPRGLDKLIKKLIASTHYIHELSVLVDWTVQTFENTEPRLPLCDFARVLEEYVKMPTAKKEATSKLTKGVVEMFIYSANPHNSLKEAEKITMFKELCGVAPSSICAAEVLLQMRADIDGMIYLDLASARGPSKECQSRTIPFSGFSGLPLEHWDAAILSALKTPGREDWEAYICFLDHLPSVLGNHSVFENRIGFIMQLGELLCTMLEKGAYPDPPASMDLTKSQLTVRLVQILTAVLSYHRHLSKHENVSMASTILGVAGSRDYIVSIPCIHALTICCYEIPDLMSSYMDDVIDKMSRMVTQRYLAIHVLLFLAGLSRLPQMFHNFQAHDYKKIFGVCGSYLQSIRGSNSLLERQQTPSSDHSSRLNGDMADALPQYVYALAHHVIAFWYIALRHDQLTGLREFVTGFLRSTGTDGRDTFEDQGLVTLDFMDRVDADDYYQYTDRELEFFVRDGAITKRHRVAGVLLVTTETAMRTGKSIITVRRPTGTTVHGIPRDQEHDRVLRMSINLTKDMDEQHCVNIVPEDSDGRAYGRFYVPSIASPLGSDDILSLPDDSALTRATEIFDRTSALDSHKAGVVYIGEDQTTEGEIFRNVQGSPDYVEFIEDLGSLRKLKGATFNTQGLDRFDDADGPHAVVWNNKVTELVFHIATLMPNNEDVGMNTATKKRHIGNDFVNIVFNGSGRAFDIDTFPSQFSAVYIVITPSARTTFLQTRQNTFKAKKDRFYRVHVITRPGYPSISSAADEKVISGHSLPGYVRNLALNDCVFSQMWSQAGEFASSWRSRLEQIRRLKDRYS